MDVLHDQFFHVRMIIGIITALGIARLLTGLMRFGCKDRDLYSGAY